MLATKGLSPKSRRNVHGVLSRALSDAVRLSERGERSRAAEARQATASSVERRAGSRFLDHVADDRLAPLWNVVAVTGCRRGEALGHRWSDLDGDIVTFTNQRAIAGGSIGEGAPKTAAGARSVALDSETVSMLASWRARRLGEFLALGIRPTHGLVFTPEDGRGLWPQRVTARFGELSDELDLPRIGLHGLRHSNATSLLGAGENPKVVSAVWAMRASPSHSASTAMFCLLSTGQRPSPWFGHSAAVTTM